MDAKKQTWKPKLNCCRQDWRSLKEFIIERCERLQDSRASQARWTNGIYLAMGHVVALQHTLLTLGEPQLTRAQGAGSHLSGGILTAGAKSSRQRVFFPLHLLLQQLSSRRELKKKWGKKKERTGYAVSVATERFINQHRKGSCFWSLLSLAVLPRIGIRKCLSYLFPQKNPHPPQAECLSRNPKFSTANNEAYT